MKFFGRKRPLNEWWLLNKDAAAVRMVQPRHGETFDEALARFLDAMPRKPYKFLAIVAEAKRMEEVRRRVESKKAKGRAKHAKIHARAS